MSGAEFVFDPLAPLDDMLIPDGWYKSRTVAASAKKTKSGPLLTVTHEIQNGEYMGRTVETLFFPENPDKKLAWISRKNLQNLMLAAGRHDKTNVDSEYIGLEIKILVGRYSKNGEERNTIKEYASNEETPSVPLPKQKTDGPVSNHGARKLYTQESFPAPEPLSGDDDVPF